MFKYVIRKVFDYVMAIIVDVVVLFATMTGYLYCDISRYTFEYLCDEYNLSVALYPTLESMYTQYEWYGVIQNVCLALIILVCFHMGYSMFKVLMDS